MKFSDFPLIYEVLSEEDLKPVRVAPNGNLICVNNDIQKYLLKECGDIEEKIFSQALPEIEGMNLDFKTLLLPEHLKVVTKNVESEENKEFRKFILINYYDGTNFNKKWNEALPDSYGGRGVDLSINDKVAGLLEDFSLIDINLLNNLDLLTFDLRKWIAKNLPFKAEKLIKKRIITKDQADKARSILESKEVFQGSKMIFTNGDFYPRNFIELSNGRIVVIDWEGREDYRVSVEFDGIVEDMVGQRNAFINYLENHASFFFVHMWGNYKVQRSFLKLAAEKFDLSIINLQAALIIKSLEQALHFLPWSEYLAVRQAEIFVNSLEKEYVEDLLK